MIRPLVAVVLYVALFAAFLFLPAPTLHWRAAWIVLAVLFVVRGASVIRLWSTQRDLIRERSKIPLHRDQVGVERPLLIGFMATFAAVIVFCSFDRWQLHAFPTLPTAIRVLGLALFVSGWWIVHLTLTTNRFAVTVVRHQEERGQSVVDHGVYAFVRHPMDAAMLLVLPGLAMWLGSAAGLITCAVPLSRRAA